MLPCLPAAALSAAREAAHPAAAAADRGDPSAAGAEVRRAVESIPAAARAILLHLPARSPGTGRPDQLMYQLDAGIRAREIPPITPSSKEQ